MTFQSHCRKSSAPALKTYTVSLWPLEGCEVSLKAASPADARRIAARSFGGDDITEWFKDADYWTIEEVIAGCV